MRRWAWWAVTALMVPVLSDAQYFGRNKVQYDRMDFRVIGTDHFRVHYYPAESVATADAARMAERWYTRHSRLLRHEFNDNPLIFYADAPDFQQSNVIEGEISQGTGGVTEGLRDRVIMPFTGIYAETDHVLGHELVHVFQYRIAEASQGGIRAMGVLPLWLVEGMAEYLSVGREDSHTAMWMRDAVRRNELPTLQQLTTDPSFFPYRYGQALWAYIGGRWGDEAVARLFRASLAQGWERGIQATLGLSPDSLGRIWHAALRTAYHPLVSERISPEALGRRVTPASDRGEQNVSPAVSPDGRYVAYFSSRGLLGMDLYLADVATGKVIRQLTSVTTDAHYDALSFLSSPGTWSPDGRRLAFVVYAGGDNELDVLDVERRRVVQRISLSDIGSITDPAWSPDGSSLVFSGMRGGISDLYLHDLRTGATRKLTDDREAQFHPAWSPDGARIAFATDAGEPTDFGTLRFGNLRTGVLEVASGRVTLLPRMGEGKEINPQFSPDGRAVYVVADPDGFSDIYRRDLAGGGITRVTRVASGVSGITANAPAMSVAKDGSILLSVFDKEGYTLRLVSPNAAEGVAFSGAPSRAGGILPPWDAPSTVTAALDAPTIGLPGIQPRGWRTEPYRGSLKLDYIGGLQLGIAGGGGYGTGVAGGVSLSFSDQLGNHVLNAVVQAQGSIRDVGAQTLYLNRERRWNWGAQAYHIPLAAGFASYEDATFNVQGQPVPGAIFLREIQRVYFDHAQLLAQYPLSQTRRFEFAVGAQRIGFNRQVDSLFAVNDAVVRRVRADLPSAAALTGATGSMAFVGDYSFFGSTSPLAGGRYRFEVAPNVGTLSYTTALADYRRYFFARPFTLAFRGFHFGRYGPAAGSNRLQPLFLGQPQLVRGYDPRGFTIDECEASATDSCPQFSRLSGSRIGVANVELRIPLLGTRQLGLIPTPLFPLEVSPFVDAGVAWSAGDQVDFQFDRASTGRVPVVSTGLAMRANLFGFAIAEVHWARPLHRPDRGWLWGFLLQPGW